MLLNRKRLKKKKANFKDNRENKYIYLLEQPLINLNNNKIKVIVEMMIYSKKYNIVTK